MYLCSQNNTLLPSWLHVDSLRLVTKTLVQQIFCDHKGMFEPCTLKNTSMKVYTGATEKSHDLVQPIRIWKIAP